MRYEATNLKQKVLRENSSNGLLQALSYYYCTPYALLRPTLHFTYWFTDLYGHPAYFHYEYCRHVPSSYGR